MLWDFVHFSYCGIFSTYHIVRFCPLFILWDFAMWNFVLWDRILFVWISACVLLAGYRLHHVHAHTHIHADTQATHNVISPMVLFI